MNSIFYKYFHMAMYLVAGYIDFRVQNGNKNITIRNSKLLNLSNLKQHSRPWRTLYRDAVHMNL